MLNNVMQGDLSITSTSNIRKSYILSDGKALSTGNAVAAKL
jgi:hypothetical protein